jgi:hypothetical protein
LILPGRKKSTFVSFCWNNIRGFSEKRLALEREMRVLLRRRFKHAASLIDRLAIFAKGARDKASRLPPCDKKYDLLKKARQADTAADLEHLVVSPGSQPQKSRPHQLP